MRWIKCGDLENLRWIDRMVVVGGWLGKAKVKEAKKWFDENQVMVQVFSLRCYDKQAKNISMTKKQRS